MRKAFQFLGGAAGALLVLELLFRCLPVSYGFGSPALSREDPVVHYFPDTNYHSSNGWMMRHSISGRINSLGFSGPDVPRNQNSAVLIGDSFIDALMIEPGKRVGDLLADRRSPLPVIGMGVAGADLADYIVAARWATGCLPVSTVLIMISENDLSSSVMPKLRGYWYVQNGAGAVVEQSPNSELRNILGRSRLGSYLIYNLKFGPQNIIRAITKGEKKAAPVQPVPRADFAARKFIADARQLSDEGVNVMLLFDGDRKAIYSGAPDGRENIHLLMREARSAGLMTLDLQQALRSQYLKSGHRIDISDQDDHWNAAGHRAVANAIRQKMDEWQKDRALRHDWKARSRELALSCPAHLTRPAAAGKEASHAG